MESEHMDYSNYEIYDFDPTQAYTNDALAQLTTLMFEGLTTLNEKGNWEKGMMKKYEKLEGENGVMKLRIELRETKWSDGRPVQANDFVFAWNRAASPALAASMLAFKARRLVCVLIAKISSVSSPICIT